MVCCWFDQMRGQDKRVQKKKNKKVDVETLNTLAISEPF